MAPKIPLPGRGTESLTSETLDVLEGAVNTAGGTFEQIVKPVRKSVLKRFPVLFLLLVTLGVSITYFGIEQILTQSPFLVNHPIVSIFIGLLILAGTGTLYKKLG